MRARVTAAAVLLAVGAAACNKKDPVQAASVEKPKPVEILVASAQQRTIDRSVTVTGSLAADETVNVSSEVPGRVARLLVDFGQAVRKGQVLAELDQRELQLAVERSRATLAQALARVGLDPDQADVKPDSSPAVRQAVAQFEDAKSKYERAARLVKSGDIAEERAVEAEKTFRAREAALQATRDDLRVQLATIRSLQADLKLQEKRMSDAVIRAPFDGEVAERLASPGQYLKENTPLLSLVKAYPLRLRIEIPEAVTSNVRIGTTLRFTTDAVPGQEFQATVRELNPSLNAQSRSLLAEARVNGTDSRLRPGVFATVKLITQPNQPVIVVPKQAVFAVAGLSKVFVVANGHAIERRIPPGETIDNDYIEVPAASVPAGAQVAVSKLNQLVDGAEVAVKSKVGQLAGGERALD